MLENRINSFVSKSILARIMKSSKSEHSINIPSIGQNIVIKITFHQKGNKLSKITQYLRIFFQLIVIFYSEVVHGSINTEAK